MHPTGLGTSRELHGALLPIPALDADLLTDLAAQVHRHKLANRDTCLLNGERAIGLGEPLDLVVGVEITARSAGRHLRPSDVIHRIVNSASLPARAPHVDDREPPPTFPT